MVGRRKRSGGKVSGRRGVEVTAAMRDDTKLSGGAYYGSEEVKDASVQ